MNCFKASQEYGIPYRTLNRGLENNDAAKHGTGPQSKQYLSMCDVNYIIYNIIRFYYFGPHHFNRSPWKTNRGASSELYIKKLQASGFPPTGETLRKLVFQFAERNLIPHCFNRDKCRAGLDWLDSFLRRFPGLD
jgi:hypothetical protein